MKDKLMPLLLSLALVAGLFGVLPAPRALAATTYYSKGSLVVNTASNWNTERDGSGTNASSFGTDNTFVIQDGHLMTLSGTATWNVGSAGTVQIESGGQWTNSSSGSITIGTFQVDNGGKYIHNTGSATVPGTTRSFAANSTYEIRNQGTSAISSGITWGNVIINLQTDPGQAVGNSANFASVQGNFTVQNTQGREYRFAAGQTTAHNIAGNLDVQGGILKFKSGSGSMTVSIGSNVGVSSGATLIATSSGAVTANVTGNWSNSGTFTADASTVNFNGSLAQTIGGTASTIFNNLTINNSAGVGLGNSQTVNGVLTLTSGLLSLGNNTLTLGSSASVSGSPDADKMVVTDVDGSQTGKLCKAGVTASGFTYPIGDALGTAEYSPVTFTPTGPSGLTVCFRVVDDTSPNMPSGLSHYLSRYWDGEDTAGSFTSYNASFTFINDASDVVGSTGSMSAKKWDTGPSWSETGGTMGAPTFSFSGMTSLSQFTAFTTGILAVTLADFYAVQQGDAVLVTWETASELDNRGFNLYRGTSPDGWDRQLNTALIPSQSQGSPGGFVYTWTDQADLTTGTTYYYWLQDVDLSGAMTMHGPVSVDYIGPTAVTLNGVQASPAAALPALPWLVVVAGAGVALALGRRR